MNLSELQSVNSFNGSYCCNQYGLLKGFFVHKIIYTWKGQEILVSEGDYEILNKNKWFITREGYVIRKITVDGKTKRVLMHRYVMNCPDGMVVDHINGDKLDNRRENLRICKQWQNKLNSTGSKNSTSNYKGVYWCKREERWMSVLRCNRKTYLNKRHKNENDAAMAYNEVALKYHGEFAKLNIINEENK